MTTTYAAVSESHWSDLNRRPLLLTKGRDERSAFSLNRLAVARDACKVAECREIGFRSVPESSLTLPGSGARNDPPRKRCTRCKRERPRTEFGRCKRSRDRLRYWCRECEAEDRRAWYSTPRGHALTRASLTRNAPKNRLKTNARKAVLRALQKGTMQRGPCELAGAMATRPCRGAVQAHHDDYTQPLAVRWLCRRHHEDIHHGDPSEPLPRGGR